MSVNARTGLSDKRENAKQLLLHYLKHASNGTPFTSGDNHTEIREIVDSICDAAIEEVTAAMARAQVPR